MERLSSEDDVHTLIATLADARYEIACVQALAAGVGIPALSAAPSDLGGMYGDGGGGDYAG